ncbi:MAG: hypothetical protein ACYCW6_09225 [Candidatus Xenobia bacterium]
MPRIHQPVTLGKPGADRSAPLVLLIQQQEDALASQLRRQIARITR